MTFGPMPFCPQRGVNVRRMKPVFEIAEHLRSGALVPVAARTPPAPIQMACLFTHRRRQDPKTRLFMEFMIDRVAATITATDQGR